MGGAGWLVRGAVELVGGAVELVGGAVLGFRLGPHLYQAWRLPPYLYCIVFVGDTQTGLPMPMLMLTLMIHDP